MASIINNRTYFNVLHDSGWHLKYKNSKGTIMDLERNFAFIEPPSEDLLEELRLDLQKENNYNLVSLSKHENSDVLYKFIGTIDSSD